MFLTSTSEDFLPSASSTTKFQNEEPKLRIFIFSNSSSSAECQKFLFSEAHFVGSIGRIIFSSEKSQKEEMSSLTQILENEVKRFEQVTGKSTRVNLENDVVVISEIETNDDESQKISEIFENAKSELLSNKSNSGVICFIFANLKRIVKASEIKEKCSKLSLFQQQLLLRAAKPSHGIDIETQVENSCEFSFVPFCVLQPGMNRRIPFSAHNEEDVVVKMFQHSITLEQVAMEMLQKSGMLGKYGA
jgi:hypothetical protein